ncbi:MAG: hypothetical protein Kow0029_03470 [Candidatus Rifleibacteriota bacterium]
MLCPKKQLYKRTLNTAKMKKRFLNIKYILPIDYDRYISAHLYDLGSLIFVFNQI